MNKANLSRNINFCHFYAFNSILVDSLSHISSLLISSVSVLHTASVWGYANVKKHHSQGLTSPSSRNLHIHHFQAALASVCAWEPTSSDAYTTARAEAESPLDGYRPLLCSPPAKHHAASRWAGTRVTTPLPPRGDFSLRTNLPFTGSPQMASLIFPRFKHKVVCVTSAQVSLLACSYVFTTTSSLSERQGQETVQTEKVCPR